MLKSFTVMLEVVTLSPASPAATAKPLRNVTQCDGVYKPKIPFLTAAVAGSSLSHAQRDADVGLEQVYSPDEFTMNSTSSAPLLPFGPDGMLWNASPSGGLTA